MHEVLAKAGEKICRQRKIRCTWALPPMYGPYRLPPTQKEINECMNACFDVWRPIWKAQEAAEHDLLKENIKIATNLFTDIVDPIKERVARHKNNLYFWICVTPGELPFGSKNKPKDLDFFADLVQKFIHRSCFKSGIACLEQKRTCKEDMRPLHPHAHILVRRHLACPPSTVVKNTTSSFQKLYKTKPTPETLYCRPCPAEFIEDKLTYISSGGKTAEGKAAIQKEDERWRKRWGFPTFWINGNIDP